MLNEEIEHVDFGIDFEEGPHLYYFGQGTNRKKLPYSVTGIISKLKPFDRDGVARTCALTLWNGNKYNKDYEEIKVECEKYPENERVDKAKDLIIKQWSGTAEDGTGMHYTIELYIKALLEGKGNEYIPEKYKWEFEHAKEILADQKAQGYIPLKTEWRIGDPNFKTRYHKGDEIGIAGSVDLILYNKLDNTCKILDWKRCKPKGSFSGEEHEKHALQLGIYHLILKKRLKFYKPVEFLIARIHPQCVGGHDVMKFNVKECEDLVYKKLFTESEQNNMKRMLKK